MNRLNQLALILCGALLLSISNPASAQAPEGPEGHETYCAHNDAAGYAARLRIRYSMRGDETWHRLHTNGITSPFRKCLHVPRAAEEIELQIIIDQAGLERITHEFGVDPIICSKVQARDHETGSNYEGMNGIHGIDFTFGGTVFHPTCHRRLH